MSKIELTNMVMIYNKETEQVLVQKRTKSWKGLCFPGGHVEDGEAIIQSAAREVKEETGLDVENLRYCGMAHFFNQDTGERYFVFHYITTEFSGELCSSEEGEVFWTNIKKLPELELSPGMLDRLPLFFGEGTPEGFSVWGEGVTEKITWM